MTASSLWFLSNHRQILSIFIALCKVITTRTPEMKFKLHYWKAMNYNWRYIHIDWEKNEKYYLILKWLNSHFDKFYVFQWQTFCKCIRRFHIIKSRFFSSLSCFKLMNKYLKWKYDTLNLVTENNFQLPMWCLKKFCKINIYG